MIGTELARGHASGDADILSAAGQRWLQVVGLAREDTVVSPRSVLRSVLAEQGWGAEGQEEEGEQEGTEGLLILHTAPLIQELGALGLQPEVASVRLDLSMSPHPTPPPGVCTLLPCSPAPRIFYRHCWLGVPSSLIQNPF